MSKIKNIFYIILITILIVAVWTIYKNNETIGKEENKYSKQKTDKNITLGIIEYDTLNPLLTTSKEVQYLTKLVYEPLINIEQDFSITQGLAEEWSKLNETTYIIKLNQNKYWHNGEKVEANDIKFTIENLKKTKTIYDINVSKIEAVEIIDNITLKIYTTEEIPYFEYVLCFPILQEGSYEYDTLEQKTEIPIGTGVYEYKKIESNEIILQNINTGKRITIKTYKNNAELYKAFSDAEIDIMLTENYNYQKYLGSIGYYEEKITGRNFTYLILNIENQEIKQAIRYAINSKDVIYNIYNDKYVEATYPLDYGSYLSNNIIQTTYDKEKVKSILLENDYTYDGETLKNKGVAIKLKLSINSLSEEHKKIAEIISENMQATGITVSIENLSQYEYEQKLKNKNYDMILHNVDMPIIPEIDEFIDISNEEAKYELEQVKNIYNESVLREKYSFLKEVYIKQGNNIGICFNAIMILHNKNVIGNFNGNWYNIFYNIDTWYKVI